MHKHILLVLHVVLLVIGRPSSCADAFAFRANLPTSTIGSLLHEAPVSYRSTHAQLSARKNDQSGTNNSDTNKRSAWSGMNSKPYVPDGLTENEYAAIRRREAEEQKSKNFGAFGPRWSRQTRPDGDWMLMRSLWTSGFDSNAPAINGGDGRSIDGNFSGFGRLSRLRQNVPIFFVSYLIAVAASVCVRLTQSEFTNPCLRSALVSASRIAVNVVSFRTQSLMQKVILPCASLLLIRPVNALIENLNRKLLWSKKRSLGIVLASTLSIVFVCAGALAFIATFNVGL